MKRIDRYIDPKIGITTVYVEEFKKTLKEENKKKIEKIDKKTTLHIKGEAKLVNL